MHSFIRTRVAAAAETSSALRDAAPSSVPVAAGSVWISTPLDPNTATAGRFDEAEGIGHLASRIIAARPFKSADDFGG